MFEHLNTPSEAYNYKLGAALNMERTVLKILDSAIEESKNDRVRELLRHHRAESEGHVRNVEEAFRAMGWEPDDSPCPAIDGLQAEAKANAKKTDDAIVDLALLQGAVEVEHHEMGAYENLIITAKAMGHNQVVGLLEQNLESERNALHLASQAEEELARATPPNAGSESPSLADRITGSA